jgi:bla regulator protein blaR1
MQVLSRIHPEWNLESVCGATSSASGRVNDPQIPLTRLIVETIFWFHPVVWWIGKRLVEERERACDEHVLSRIGDPEPYAEGILTVCRFYLQSPLVSAFGITGSDLRKRIEMIMANPAVHSLDLRRKLVLALAGVVTVTIPLAIGIVSSPATLAQSSAAGGKRLGFEVASIKASKPGGHGTSLLTDPAGRFTAENATLRTIITFAFGVRGFQMSGGPSWLDSDRFDIVAKPEGRSNPAQLRQMVQSLLADRFKLKFHRETKEMRVLALVVGKNGPKLKPTKPEDDAARSNRGFQGGMGELTALGADMASLATRLSAIVGRPVIDRTALTGRFDFKLQWTPDHPVQMKSPDEPVADGEHGPSIFTAVQQLGLKLEDQKEPVEIIVIDSVEKPSAN